ncbi:MAG: N-acetyltransferase [Porphyromonadaceae bacterium]|nr:MAG: N-acetyltransferase [Porphyromonadaceae bacterium]
MVTLTSNRVTLRPWRENDLTSLVRHANNFNIWINLRDGFPHPYTEEAGRGWLKMAMNEATHLFLAIEVDGEAVGGIGATFKDDVYRINAEIGYWLSEEYWGQGLVSNAVTLLVDYIYDKYPAILRIYADLFSHNPASARVLQKCGFHLEAIHKNAVIKNGKVIDEHRYVKFR